MIKQKGKYLFFVTGFIACFFSVCCAQGPSIKTTLDKDKVVIGDQFKLKVEADFSAKDFSMFWLAVPDSMQHFELIDKGEIDSLYTGNELVGVSQTFTLTSFDSGKWNLPVFPVHFISHKVDTSFNLYTDSLPVTIYFSPADTTEHFKEIKPIIEVKSGYPLWLWISVGAFILLLIIGLVWYFRRRKNKPAANSSSGLSAYEDAMKELEALKKYPLSKPSEIKLFHSKLIDIFKNYLSRKQSIGYSNKTTSDILIQFNNSVDKITQSELAAALRCGDAVKFAKYIPPIDENNNSLSVVRKTIDLLNKQNL